MNTKITRAVKLVLKSVGYEFVRNKKGGLLIPVGTDWFHWQRGIHRTMFRKHLQAVLRQRQIELVLDVGANIGQYALELRELGYNGEIVSFEPSEKLYQQLELRARQDDKWRVLRLALGNTTGSIEFNQTRNPLLCSILSPGRDYTDIVGAGKDIIGTEEVPIARLEDIWEQVVGENTTRGIMLKMDTQGYNMHVFQGVMRYTGKIDVLQSELSTGELYVDAADMLEELSLYTRCGYHISCIHPLTITKLTRRIIEYDCIMVNERNHIQRQAVQ